MDNMILVAYALAGIGFLIAARACYVTWNSRYILDPTDTKSPIRSKL